MAVAVAGLVVFPAFSALGAQTPTGISQNAVNATQGFSDEFSANGISLTGASQGNSPGLALTETSQDDALQYQTSQDGDSNSDTSQGVSQTGATQTGGSKTGASQQESFQSNAPQLAKLNIEGTVSEETVLWQGGKAYLPFKALASKTGIAVEWEKGSGSLILTYPDFSVAKADTKADRIYNQETALAADFLVFGGSTYISIEDLQKVVKRNVSWDRGSMTLSFEGFAAAGKGDSILTSLPYEGLDIKDNAVYFSVDGLPQSTWQMGGELRDLWLIDRTVQGEMEEIHVAASYVQPNGQLSKLSLFLRKLPGGDRMIFTRADSLGSDQVLTISTEGTGQVYGSSAYHFIDKGSLRQFLSQEPYQPNQRLFIKAGTSVDQWHIFSGEDLTLTSPIARRAWNASLDYHGTNAWVTPAGTYRSTPPEYFNQPSSNYYNVNLQASSPLLLLDSLNVMPSRLLEDFVHSAKFTLVKMRGNDGYWRSGLNVAYLDRAYNLGPNYIDTRMSVDASLFLLKYGSMFNDWDAVNKGAWFKNFFLKMKSINAVYTLGGGVFYPDYYSESQRTKTLVSLNHAVYEMNYLYTLYNTLGDHEAKQLADEMRLFINNSKDRWVAPDGDLYYALSPDGVFYAEDYVNITYVDLNVAKSILEYMEVKDTAVEDLLAKKDAYLDAAAAPQFESHLGVEEVLQKFDFQSSRKGDFFFLYPLEVKLADEVDSAYFACGAYHWFKGVESVTYLGKTYNFDPKQKYHVALTKWGLTARMYGEDTLLPNTGGESQE